MVPDETSETGYSMPIPVFSVESGAQSTYLTMWLRDKHNKYEKCRVILPPLWLLFSVRSQIWLWRLVLPRQVKLAKARLMRDYIKTMRNKTQVDPMHGLVDYANKCLS